jgi:flavodoxin
MNTKVVYYSKTGNTKTIADSIANSVGCDSIAINLMKHGRKTKKEIEDEKQIFRNAVEQCNNSDLVFIGTPTMFRKPYPQIMEFIGSVCTKKAAIFCTYYGMLGATFYDMETLLLQRGIVVVNKLNLTVGTEKYRFHQNVSQYKEKITSQHLITAKEFASRTISLEAPLPLRLNTVCGNNCLKCSRYGNDCKGAGYQCWSEKNCAIFECCVIRKSLEGCRSCSTWRNCIKLSYKKCCLKSCSN